MIQRKSLVARQKPITNKTHLNLHAGRYSSVHYYYIIPVPYCDWKTESYKELFSLDVCPPNRRQLNKIAVSLVWYTGKWLTLVALFSSGFNDVFWSNDFVTAFCFICLREAIEAVCESHLKPSGNYVTTRRQSILIFRKPSARKCLEMIYNHFWYYGYENGPLQCRCRACNFKDCSFLMLKLIKIRCERVEMGDRKVANF